MIHPRHIQERLAPFTKSREADKIGITFFRSNIQVSRFANSAIHQNMSDEAQSVYFRVLCNGRLGVASTNSLQEHNLESTFQKALRIAKLKIEIRQKRDIPLFRPVKTIPGKLSLKTIHTSAADRARILKKIFSNARRSRIQLAGNLHNGFTQMAVIYPAGEMNYQDYSFCGVKFIAACPLSSGYAASVHYDIDKLNPDQSAKTAIEKCLLGRKKTALAPGRYDVILESAASAEILLWLNYIGFGAKNFLEETSFLYKKTGKRLSAKTVDIYDYGSGPDTFILPFDFEGTPRQKTYLIKNGIAQKPLTDSYYSRLLKIRNSGHANFPDDTEGPLGYNLIMQNGNLSKEEILRQARKAILVSRFHYINGFLDTHKAQMTGMTRDGTFLVEEGRIKQGIKDMRFTESILEAFSRIRYISRESQIIAEPLESLGSVCAPTLYIPDFNFIS